MADSAFIFEATPDNFTQLVLDNSAKGPVLVNYWAPWAGPCLKLWPVLEQLARHYAGRFLLVNINTDTHKKLARDYGINSLPTLKMYRYGKVVDPFGHHWSIAEHVEDVTIEETLRRMAAFTGASCD